MSEVGKTLYGDAMIELGYTYVNCGMPSELHDIFDLAVENGAKGYDEMKFPHPLNVHQRVLNALDRDKRFKKMWITYPGIYRKPVRDFVLIENKVGDQKDRRVR